MTKVRIEYKKEIRTRDTHSKGELIQPSGNDILLNIVDARLDLPISHRLLGQNYPLAVIRRGWNDQFLFKCDDFVSDCDLLVSCMILQKQIEHIHGKSENIIIPSEQMRAIRKKHQAGRVPRDYLIDVSSSRPYYLCLPCGHLIACVSRNDNLQLCTICRHHIDSFVRIYI